MRLSGLVIKRNILFYFIIIILALGLLIILGALSIRPEIVGKYVTSQDHLTTATFGLYKAIRSISLFIGCLFILCSLFFIKTSYFCSQLAKTFINVSSGVLQSFQRYSKHLLVGFFLCSFLLLAVFSLFVLKDFPNSGDEYAYVFQAKTFLQGRFYNEPHPAQEFFNFTHIFAKEGKWFSKFPPGWPIVLMIGNFVKIPMGLINPLIGGLSVLVFFLLAKRLYNENIAIVSCLSLIFSPFFIFNCSSYFSHNLASLFILLFSYLSILYVEDERDIYSFLAGLVIGFAFITRYYTALVCSVPIILYIVSRKRSKVLVFCFYCVIGSIPLIAFHMLYNYRITGSPLLLVTQWAVPDDIIGFVRGHTFGKGVWYAVCHFVDLIEWTSPFMIFLYLGGLVLSVRKKNAFYFDLMFVFLVFGYLIFYSVGGNRYGPRYYYEGYPFLILAVVSNVELAAKERVLKDFLVVLFCLGFFLGVLSIPSIAVQEHEVIFERMDVYRLVKEANIDNAIVFVKSTTGVRRPMYRSDLIRNGVSLKGSVLYAKDRGAVNVELKKYFPHKEFYIYTREQHSFHGTLRRMKFD